MTFYIYILSSLDCDKYYIGHTPDVEKRLHEHNHPQEASKFTAKYLPWKVVASFPVSENRGEAMMVERFIKNQRSRRFIEKIISNQNEMAFIQSIIIKSLDK